MAITSKEFEVEFLAKMQAAKVVLNKDSFVRLMQRIEDMANDQQISCHDEVEEVTVIH